MSSVSSLSVYPSDDGFILRMNRGHHNLKIKLRKVAETEIGAEAVALLTEALSLAKSRQPTPAA